MRAAVLAGLSALLTAAGHTAGGGAVPDLDVLVVLLPLLAGLFTTVAGRSRGPLATVAVLGAGQLALHQLMDLLHPAHHPVAGPALAGWRMVAMHAVATLVLAVLVRHADRAAAALAAALGRVVRRRLVPPPADRPLPVRPVPDLAIPLRLGRALAAAQPRRGPPVRC
ncbi:hypothetical protein BJF78_28730 [Pseudonocardia sp. CNS-139]|nr:hypothetical protein BJF78_28730 [Pseudonocardia sp. CNS-139]